MSKQDRVDNTPVVYFTDGTACIDTAFFKGLDLNCLSPEYLELQCAIRGKKVGHPLFYGLLCGGIVSKAAYDTALECIRSTSMFDKFLGDMRTAKLLETLYSYSDYTYSQSKRMQTVRHAVGFWTEAVRKTGYSSGIRDWSPTGRKEFYARKARKLALYDAIWDKAGDTFLTFIYAFAWRFDDKPSWSFNGFEGDLLEWRKRKLKERKESVKRMKALNDSLTPVSKNSCQ